MVDSGGWSETMKMLKNVATSTRPCDVNRIVAGNIVSKEINGCDPPSIDYVITNDVKKCGLFFYNYSVGFSLPDMIQWLLKKRAPRFGFIFVPDSILFGADILRKFLLEDIGTNEPVHIALIECGYNSESKVSIVSRYGNAHMSTTDYFGKTVYLSDAYNGLVQSLDKKPMDLIDPAFPLFHWDKTLHEVTNVPREAEDGDLEWEIVQRRPRVSTVTGTESPRD